MNLKHQFLCPFAAAVCLTALTPLFFNIDALQGADAARPLEFWLCFVGVILIVSVLMPEQDKEIRDVICSRRLDHSVVCLIRLLYSVITMSLLIALFVGIMKLCECDVRAFHVYTAIAESWFLGAAGFAAAGLTGNITAGYMAAVLYYLANYGLKGRLGVFFLFSMSYGDELHKSGWLAGGAFILTVITLAVIKYRHKCICPFIKYEDK